MASKKNSQRMTNRQIREAKKQAKRRAFFEAHRMPIIIGGIAVVVLLVALILVVDYTYAPDGSMRVFLGRLQGAQENSIIREVNGHYYELARMNVPEGYESADYALLNNSSSQEQFRYFSTEDDARVVKSVLVSGIGGRTAETMIATLQTASSYMNVGEPKTAEIAGYQVHYLYTFGALTEDTENGDYSASLAAYVDTIKGSTVLVSCGSAELPQAELPTEEAMVAELSAILTRLEIPAE